MERGPLAARAEELESDGRSVSWIAATSPKKRLIGLLAFGDEAKTSAKEAIEILHRRGVRSIMLTGDNAGSANAVAKQLGIDEVIANVLPEGNADAVASLRGEDRTVAMVGAGVNDAPGSAERRVGKVCVRTFRSRVAPGP